MTNNAADADLNGSGKGGGIDNASAISSTVTLQNSIVARNAESVFFAPCSCRVPVDGDCAGTLDSNGNDIVFSKNCTINGTVTVADPRLGPLANNGGPTPTHALPAGSPAIDAGETPNCTGLLGAVLPTDQRGFRRPANGGTALRCDIGAYEFYPLALHLPVIGR